MSAARVNAAATVVALLAATAAGALKPRADYLSTPELANIAYEDVRIQAVDGVALHGWFMPFQDQDGRAFHDAGPIVILPTDGEDNMSAVLWHYYTFFRGAPWHVLAFDWRGFGTSGAWAIDTTQVVIPELMTDLTAAIEYAKGRPEYDGENLGLLAVGPAAAVALAVSAGRTDLRALVVRGVYTTQAEYCAQMKRAKEAARCGANARWPARLEPVEAAKKVETPVLIVVGEDDQVTPPAMARAVLDSLAGPKEFWIAPKAGHTGFESPEFIHQRPFTLKLHGFFRLHLGTAGH